ncbi:hypothetical protein [Sulfurospirillum barnesii]|uniref:hypothetical protein n=1 Tax=Sulfurospirillum barnesii TaxID=44674 RepID=UPI0005A26B27|nr:hypothetical protein [Sulfurospirillum barnesii]
MKLIHFSDTHLGDFFHSSYSPHFTLIKVALLTKHTLDLINLMLRIVFSKTLRKLNTANSAWFLAFDEVFGSQDENRRMEILEAFHTIKEQYSQIFLISHEMKIKEMFERVGEL